MNEVEYKVVRKMELYGGSFVKALANCFLKADRTNVCKLKKAFPEYWKEYSNMVFNK